MVADRFTAAFTRVDFFIIFVMVTMVRARRLVCKRWEPETARSLLGRFNQQSRAEAHLQSWPHSPVSALEHEIPSSLAVMITDGFLPDDVDLMILRGLTNMPKNPATSANRNHCMRCAQIHRASAARRTSFTHRLAQTIVI
jgi:hypothetical protein